MQGAHHLSRPHLREGGNRLIQKIISTCIFFSFFLSLPFFFIQCFLTSTFFLEFHAQF